MDFFWSGLILFKPISKYVILLFLCFVYNFSFVSRDKKSSGIFKILNQLQKNNELPVAH